MKNPINGLNKIFESRIRLGDCALVLSHHFGQDELLGCAVRRCERTACEREEKQEREREEAAPVENRDQGHDDGEREVAGEHRPPRPEPSSDAAARNAKLQMCARSHE